MDGGALVINEKGQPQTVWNRNGTIFAAAPSQPEVAVGQGRSCTLESIGSANAYAWVEQGEVVVKKPGAALIKLGTGNLPVLKAINTQQLLCVWENNKQLHASVIPL